MLEIERLCRVYGKTVGCFYPLSNLDKVLQSWRDQAGGLSACPRYGCHSFEETLLTLTVAIALTHESRGTSASAEALADQAKPCVLAKLCSVANHESVALFVLMVRCGLQQPSGGC